MDFLGIGFVILCWYAGKGWYESSRVRSFIALCSQLPEDERHERMRDYLDNSDLD